MEKSNDLRVIKTKQFLKEALLVLLKKMDFEEITIMKLTTQAQINRSTFYAHFYDKYDLLEKTINEELLSFVEEVAPKSEEELTLAHIPNPFYVRATKYIYQHGEFFQVMMGENGISSFQQRLLKIIEKYMLDYLEKLHPRPDKMEIPKELFVYYVAHGYVGAISYWLENDMPYSPEYMAEKLSLMTIKGSFHAAGLK
ncbi:TetR family transcriptional regulator C-terminal domain-containing protein [Virgibacillus sp. NKC19-3]|uniref:TetR/AcrR family transcriptional regulator n=1 Tax=Virgibacillus saliphilus TaxID=2831674 RepID=UPI001C9AB1A7|nr:TetR-like C-terminal domain-containing protein [Virgibacillus sp. NKC19-3]MBY7142577.1 TetR family transcriptional regulator C-terminal domain-containing protein [Virgibacillus sp. NKC19-3]